MNSLPIPKSSHPISYLSLVLSFIEVQMLAFERGSRYCF